MLKTKTMIKPINDTLILDTIDDGKLDSDQNKNFSLYGIYKYVAYMDEYILVSKPFPKTVISQAKRIIKQCNAQL